MAWEPDHFRLFVSHVSAYHKEAADIATMLRDWYGIDGFVAHVDIEPSTDWQNEIEAALNSMDAMLAVLTPGFSASVWCNQEVGWSLGRQTLALSLRMGEDPRGFAGRFQAISSGDGNAHGIADRIFGVLASHARTAERIAVVSSMRLRRTVSWESIRDWVAPQLSRLTVHTPEVLDNLEAAFQESYHVRTSHYLGAVRNLLAQNGRQVPAG